MSHNRIPVTEPAFSFTNTFELPNGVNVTMVAIVQPGSNQPEGAKENPSVILVKEGMERLADQLAGGIKP